MRITLQAILEQAGYPVSTAGGDEAAQARLWERGVDAVVSDLQLGLDGDGLAVLAAAKARAPDTTAVVLTGYGSVEAVVQALRGKVDDFLLKPSEVEDLKRVVARGVEQRRLVQRAALAEEHARLYRAEREARAEAEAARRRLAV